MRIDGAVDKVAKPPYRFPRSAPYGIKEALRLFANVFQCFALSGSRFAPVCANKDAVRHFIDGAATPPWKGGELACLNILPQFGKMANLQTSPRRGGENSQSHQNGSKCL
jgi:hypothetical protein